MENNLLTRIDPLHQEVERVHKERGQALFQLKARLERAAVSHPNDSIPQEYDVAKDEGKGERLRLS